MDTEAWRQRHGLVTEHLYGGRILTAKHVSARPGILVRKSVFDCLRVRGGKRVFGLGFRPCRIRVWETIFPERFQNPVSEIRFPQRGYLEGLKTARLVGFERPV